MGVERSRLTHEETGNVFLNKWGQAKQQNCVFPVTYTHRSKYTHSLLVVPPVETLLQEPSTEVHPPLSPSTP